MKIAVEGCAHGELDKIYECIETIQAREGIRIDLLICCGDFQSVRNADDLNAMAVPEKYQRMCTFYKYYSGEKQAPILTLFIGGNHEASNYLQELPFGGWVAPNIYYLGRAGIVQVGNLRIGGLSGIYKGHDYFQGLWESSPYTQNSLRSVYHVRSFDVFRLSQVKEKVNIMLSHDWPRGITEYGDKFNLLKRKPFLREDVESNLLGSVPAEKLLHKLKPDYWFAAHLHCQFAALINHDDERETKFLALDKCLPKRRHLQILDIPPQYDGDKSLHYDAEWLAILKSTNHLLTVKNIECHMPGPGGNERYDFAPTADEKEEVIKLMGNMIIEKDNFIRTAPVYIPGFPKRSLPEPIINPQTVKLCEKLGIDDPLQVVMARTGRVMTQPCSTVASSQVSVLQTPTKNLKLSLPAPVTPSNNDDQQNSHKNLDLSINSPTLDSDCNISKCLSPLTVSSTKKVFKRRNISMYTSEESECTTLDSIIDSDSPPTSKVHCKTNML